MATTVTPLPQLDRQSPNFRPDVNQFFGTLLPNFTVQINQVSFELMTARNETVAARNEVVPLANQVVALAPGAIAASQTVQILAPQVEANAASAANSATQAQASAASAAQVALGGSTGMPAFPPTMLNDWANSRSLDNRFTFSRGLAATAIDALGKLRTFAAGQPVFEYDATLRCRGLRVEPARTNVQIQSENITAAGWSLQGATVTADVRAAPNGTMTMDKLVESTAVAEHGATTNTQGPVTTGALWCYSIFAAAGERRYLRMLLPTGMFGSNMSCLFDLLTGAIVSQPTAPAKAGIEFVNGAWRVWMSAAVAITGNQVPAQLRMQETTATASYTGDGSSGLFIWGGQFEQGASPTSYIPTTTVAVTRPADVVTLPAAATAEVLNPAQGAFLVEFTLNAAPAGSDLWDILEYSNGSDAERLFVRASSSSLQIVMTSGSTNVLIQTALSSPIIAGSRCRLAFSYSSAGVRSSVNGAAVAASVPTGVVALTWNQLTAGSARGSRVMNGHIAHLHPYARIPSDSELRAMSALP